MNTSPESYSEIELAAADWLSRRDSGLTSAQEMELSGWLSTDPRHAKAFHELAGAWRRLDLVRDGGKPAVERTTERPRRAMMVRFPQVVVVAMAASIVIAAVAWRLRPAGENRFATTASTATGVTRSLPLPDGSMVQLNRDSAVAVRYESTGRHVRLIRGEAHFTVAQDKSKPFIVSVGQVAVRAVGTAFNVRLTSASVEVLVTEGKVAVDDAGKGHSLLAATQTRPREDAVLAAGERVVVPLDSIPPVPVAVAEVPAEEIRHALAWKEPRLEFDTVPLKDIVAEFNRFNRHRLLIADTTLENLRFGGTFPADDYESLVRLLVRNYGVTAETQADQTILRLAPANQAAQR
jgi:transmembrane sensor